MLFFVPNDIEALRAAFQAGKRPKYVFFWGHEPEPDGAAGRGCLSQWWAADFEVGGLRYPSAEHYMMAEKARLFGDEACLQRILRSPHPGAAKKLGRAVGGFDETVWERERFQIVVRGNLAKFRQNDDLARYLIGTKQRVIVEASPRDRIWGIGMTRDDPRAINPLQWRGLNLLGFALMEVRAALAWEESP